MINRWSPTQRAIAVSPAEADLHAAMRTLSETTLKHLGAKTFARIFASGPRHTIETAEIWGPGRVRAPGVGVVEVDGEHNPADVLTKPVPRRKVHKCGTWTLWDADLYRRALNPKGGVRVV